MYLLFIFLATLFVRISCNTMEIILYYNLDCKLVPFITPKHLLIVLNYAYTRVHTHQYLPIYIWGGVKGGIKY